MAPAAIDMAQVVDVKAQQRQGALLLTGPVELPLADRQEGVAGRQAGDRAEPGQAAEFDFAHHQLGEQLQLVNLQGAGLAGLLVDHAERAEIVASGTLQGGAGIEADVGRVDHQGIGAEAFVGQGIRHHQHRVGGNGMGAEGHGAGRFGGLQALVGEEPLAILFHQGDQRDRHLENRTGQLDDAIEVLVAGDADHAMAFQIAQALILIGGNRVGRIGGQGETSFSVSR